MRNINILSHFEEELHSSGITIFKLKEVERADFLSKIFLPYRTLYINDEDLAWRIANDPETNRAAEIIDKIPDDPSIMSGEFAEILCYYLIPEKHTPNSTLRPPKWKWKESKNNPAHFTDVVLFNQIDRNNPGTGDSIISIESKARATRPSSTESSLLKAITDAVKDSTSRLAESMFHLKTKYKDDRNADAIGQLKRFMDVARFPTFLKNFKAIAVVDDAFADVHVGNVGVIPTNINDSFEVVLIRIAGLKLAYELTYREILNT